MASTSPAWPPEHGRRHASLPHWEDVLIPRRDPQREVALQPVGDDAQVASGDERDAVRPLSNWSGHRRPRLQAVESAESGLDARVRVTLAADGRVAARDVATAATERARLRAVGRSTLGALQRLVGDAARLELESVSLRETRTGTVATAVVTLLTAAGEQRLAGAAPAGDHDRETAAARAVLDAVTRRLQWIAHA